jgi:hypothetical protein
MEDGKPDNRREERLRQSLPIRVVGYDAETGAWEELTETLDFSEGGAAFTLSRALFRGQALHLMLPLPRSLRRHDHDQPAYRIWAVVRDALVQDGGSCRVGVKYFGKDAPRGYQENPMARFLLPSDVGQEVVEPQAAPAQAREPPVDEERPDPWGRRAHPRFDIFVEFAVELIDEWGAVLADERTVAENISRGGARLRTAGPFAQGDVIVLREVGGQWSSRAEIRYVGLGKDRVRRLHVQFLDGRSPSHLVRPR